VRTVEKDSVDETADPDTARVDQAPSDADGERSAYSVSLLIPAYNEEEVLEASITTLVGTLSGLKGSPSWEIVIVDDGSTDATPGIADELAQRHADVRTHHLPSNFNIGQALRFGFANCVGDCIIAYDADLSYGPEHIELLLDTMQNTGAKVVTASPYAPGGALVGVPWHRARLSRLANRFLRLMSKSHVTAVTGMVRAYDRRFIQRLDLKSMDNEINAEIIYKAELLNARIVEVPATLTWTRGPDENRGSTISIRKSAAGFAFSGFLFRPLLFFVVPGLITLALALYTLMWAGYHLVVALGASSGSLDARLSYAANVAFEHSPHSFVIGGLALLVAIQLISLGFLSAQSKRYFEDLFHLGMSVHGKVSESEAESR
jgi:glycosyltransferase involved in cell wall biosynthesis